MRIRVIWLVGPLLAISGISTASPMESGCRWATDSATDLDQWQRDGFPLTGGEEPAAHALALAACLGEPDPYLRDTIAIGALTAWMRRGAPDPQSLRQLELALLSALDGDDDSGFRKPFAALALSEVVRTDRIDPWMTPAQRAGQVTAAARYLASVRDYRGFVNGEGWRHGVAHGADWAMQLMLDEALDPALAMSLLDAIAVQVMPADRHVYAFGEPDRLARPVVFAATRGDIDPAALAGWLDGLLAGLGLQSDSAAQEEWLLRHWHLKLFVHALQRQVADNVSRVPPAFAASVEAAASRLP